MKRVLGIINLHHSTELKQLNVRRSLASTSFLARYSFIDFPLSNFANSDINQVGVLIKEKTRSLFRHLGVTEQVWTQNSKTGGIYLMHHEAYATNPKLNHDINNMLENIWVLRNAKADLVIFAPVHFLMRVDYKQVLEQHQKSKADITFLYHNVTNGKEQWIDTQVLTLENGVVKNISINKGTKAQQNIFLETFVLSKALLLELIKEAKHLSSYYNLRDMIKMHLNDLKVIGLEHKGLVRLIDDEVNYMKTSFDLLDLNNAVQIFKENWPIYTRTYDTPPTKYGQSAKVVNSYIANGSLVLGTVKNSIIGRDVVIEAGAVVENSIIMSHVRVSKNSKLNYVIVDKEASMRTDSNLVGTADQPLIIKQEEKV